MKKLDKRGVAALEFCLVAAPVFILMFAILDLGRYAITIQSLQMLSGAGARQCYINGLATCTNPLLSDATMQAVAPFLYAGGLTPTLHVCGPQTVATNDCPIQTANVLTVTASQPNFTLVFPKINFFMVFPKIWGTALNAPSASTSIPF
jgi:Flp pilus assembly protein TadG